MAHAIFSIAQESWDEQEEVMAKVAEDAAAAELPLNDERLEVKVPRHITIAVNHLNKQREKAQARFDQAEAELKVIDGMIALAKG